MAIKDPETLRISLAPHVGETLGFYGYVEDKKTNSGHYNVCVTQVKSDNDPEILLNHVWISVVKHDFDYLMPEQLITFSGKVVAYRKAKKLTRDGLASTDDYTIEIARNVQVQRLAIGEKMYRDLGNTIPYVAPAAKKQVEVPSAPIVIEQEARKKSIFEILLEKKKTLNMLSRQLGKSTAYFNIRQMQSQSAVQPYYQSQYAFAKMLQIPIEKIDFSSQEKINEYHIFSENIRHDKIRKTAVELNKPVENFTAKKVIVDDDFSLWIPFSDWCEQHGQQPSKHLFSQWKEFREVTA